MINEPDIELGTVTLPLRDTFRILIMDTKAHADQLKAVCRGMGHNVIAAHSIDEAFAFLDGTNHADVIICAAYLENQSTFEFLRRLRKDPIHKETIFIIMALEPGPAGVRLNASVETSGKILGADAFVFMPVFDAEQLVSDIKQLLPIIPALEKSRLEKDRKNHARGNNQQ